MKNFSISLIEKLVYGGYVQDVRHACSCPIELTAPFVRKSSG